MNPSPLLTLPKELLLIILSLVERRRDLESLALASKVIYRIVVPLFLDVVHIRCDLRRVDIWQWLASKPHRAASVRTLELYDESGKQDRSRPIIPSSFLPDLALEYSGTQVERRETKILEESVLSLAEAVKLMTRLRRFRWSIDLSQSVVPSLKPLFSSLEQLNVMDEFYFAFQYPISFFKVDDEEPPSAQFCSPFSNSHNITTLYLELQGTPQWLNSLIPHWIIQLKQINNLYLSHWDTFGDELDLTIIYDHAQWPCLVELSLPGDMSLQSVYDVNDEEHAAGVRFANFINRHPCLQRLNLSEAIVHPKWLELIQPQRMSQLRSLIWHDHRPIQPQTMSQLRSLSWHDHRPAGPPLNHWFPDDRLPGGIPLQYLNCPISMESIPVLQRMTSLRVVESYHIDLRTFEQVVEAVPQIQQLSIPCSYWYPTDSDARRVDDRIANSLLKLKHLTHLEGLSWLRRGGKYCILDGVVNRLMCHECLLYIDSLTWPQLDLILEHWRAGWGDIDDILCELKAAAAVPTIQESTGFYRKTSSAPLVV